MPRCWTCRRALSAHRAGDPCLPAGAEYVFIVAVPKPEDLKLPDIQVPEPRKRSSNKRHWAIPGKDPDQLASDIDRAIYVALKKAGVDGLKRSQLLKRFQNTPEGTVDSALSRLRKVKYSKNT